MKIITERPDIATDRCSPKRGLVERDKTCLKYCKHDTTINLQGIAKCWRDCPVSSVSEKMNCFYFVRSFPVLLQLSSSSLRRVTRLRLIQRSAGQDETREPCRVNCEPLRSGESVRKKGIPASADQRAGYPFPFAGSCSCKKFRQRTLLQIEYRVLRGTEAACNCSGNNGVIMKVAPTSESRGRRRSKREPQE